MGWKSAENRKDEYRSTLRITSLASIILDLDCTNNNQNEDCLEEEIRGKESGDKVAILC